MGINLNSKEEQNKFIKDNLSNLLESINETYGPILVEELMNRLRFTVNEFNEEISSAFNQLKEKESNRQKMYSMIKEGNIPIDDTNEDTKTSDWEKTIDEIESQE